MWPMWHYIIMMLYRNLLSLVRQYWSKRSFQIWVFVGIVQEWLWYPAKINFHMYCGLMALLYSRIVQVVKSPSTIAQHTQSKGVVKNLAILVILLDEDHWSLWMKFMTGNTNQLSASIVNLVLATRIGLPRKVIECCTTNSKQPQWDAGKVHDSSWQNRNGDETAKRCQHCGFM